MRRLKKFDLNSKTTSKASKMELIILQIELLRGFI